MLFCNNIILNVDILRQKLSAILHRDTLAYKYRYHINVNEKTVFDNSVDSYKNLLFYIFISTSEFRPYTAANVICKRSLSQLLYGALLSLFRASNVIKNLKCH